MPQKIFNRVVGDILDPLNVRCQDGSHSTLTNLRGERQATYLFLHYCQAHPNERGTLGWLFDLAFGIAEVIDSQCHFNLCVIGTKEDDYDKFLKYTTDCRASLGVLNKYCHYHRFEEGYGRFQGASIYNVESDGRIIEAMTLGSTWSPSSIGPSYRTSKINNRLWQFMMKLRQGELTKVNDELGLIKKQLIDVTGSRNALQEKCGELLEANTVINGLQKELTEVKNELASRDKQLKDSIVSMKDLQNGLTTRDKQLGDVTERYNAVQKELQKVKKKLATDENLTKVTAIIKNTLQSELTTVTNEFGSIKEQLMEELASSDKQLKAATVSKNELQKKLTEVTNKLVSRDQQLLDDTERTNNLQDRLTTRDEQLKDVTKRYNALNMKLIAVEGNLTRSQEQLTTVTNENEQLRENLDSRCRQLNSLQTRVKRYNMSLGELLEKRNRIKKEAKGKRYFRNFGRCAEELADDAGTLVHNIGELLNNELDPDGFQHSIWEMP